MKTIFKTILAVLVTAFIASCSDVPAPYNMPGEGGNDGGGETTSAIFEQDFSKGQGDFTIQNVTKPADLSSEIWTYQSQYKSMVAKAYIDGQRYATESILVSPEIDLSSYNEDLKVTINNASNYFASLDVMKEQAQVVVSTDDGATWTPLTLSEYAKNDKDFTFVNSEASLTPYAGKKIKLGFKYTSTESQTGTWEISKVTIEKGKASEGGSDTPSTGEAEGTKVNPYNVAAALTKTADAGKQAWVKGYIVGYMKNTGTGNVAEFAGGGQDDNNKDFNVLLADSKEVKDVSQCMAVKLSSAIRPSVGLQTNESNLGKEVSLYGTFAANKYGSMFILDAASAAIIDGNLVGTDPDAGGGETPEPTTTPGTLTKASNLTEGTYAIGYYDGSLFKLMTNVIPDGSYYGQSADWTSGGVPANCQFKITKSGNNWVIQGVDGKYVYVQKNGTHYDLKFDGSDSSVLWALTDESNGIKAVYGDMTTNWLAYNTNYKNWQMAYSGTKNAVYPSFYKIK